MTRDRFSLNRSRSIPFCWSHYLVRKARQPFGIMLQAHRRPPVCPAARLVVPMHKTDVARSRIFQAEQRSSVTEDRVAPLRRALNTRV